MSGLGNIFPGLGKGVEKGLQYDAQFLASFVWAIKNGKTEALNALVVIAEQNIKEVLDSAGNVLPTVVGSLITGGDPFAGSRHAFQAWQAKYGVHH